MANTHASLLFSSAAERDQQRRIEAIVATQAAYMEAIERVLAAPANSLYRAGAEAVMVWVAAIQLARLGSTPMPDRRRES